MRPYSKGSIAMTKPKLAGIPTKNLGHLGHFAQTKFLRQGHNTIVKVGRGFEVHAEHGSHRNLGGPYASKAEAVKRLRQVEYFKHHKG